MSASQDSNEDHKMHIPVLLKEILGILNPRPGEIYIDATVNGGGHAREIAVRVGPEGKVIGIDRDCEILRESEIRNRELGIKNIELFCENYTNIEKIARQAGIEKADGILFDLGFSSYHVDQSGRGFSFLKDEPLDMRYGREEIPTARDIVNKWPIEDLVRIFREYGEERYAREIARAIAEGRARKPILRTGELAEIIREAKRKSRMRERIHPATRVFQALRIAVNREFEAIGAGLEKAALLLRPGGTLAVISFHSLEDRMVKNFFREWSKRGYFHVLTPKPLKATRGEVNKNPRSRSALLRAGRRMRDDNAGN